MNKEKIQKFDISDKAAVVIGCGGLGCNIAIHLAGSGIGKLTLCDFDKVSESNLNRQLLYTEADIGKSKVICAGERIKAYSHETEVISIERKITSESDFDFLFGNDIVFLAVDNNDARKIITRFCAEKKIALVNGGINGFFGTAYLYVPDKTPCPECAGLLQADSKTIASVSSTAGVIGALQCELGIRFLLDNETDSAGRLYIYDNSTITKLLIKKNHDCIICGRKHEV